MQIYKIEFIDGSTYIGQTTGTFDVRFKEHLYKLNKGTHHSKKMQQAYNTMGTPIVSVIEDNIHSYDELNIREKYWIDLLDTFNNGLNHTIGGEGVGTGSNSPASKLTEDDYLAILTFLAETEMTQKEIASELEVPISIVNNISSGYTHLYFKDTHPELYNKVQLKKNNRSNRVHQDETYYNVMVSIAESDLTYDEIAEIYGINKSIVGHIASGSRHTYLKEVYPLEYKRMLDRDRKHIKKGGSRDGKEYSSLLSPTNIIHKVTNILQFAKEHKLDPGSINRLVHGKQNKHKGWTRA